MKKIRKGMMAALMKKIRKGMMAALMKKIRKGMMAALMKKIRKGMMAKMTWATMLIVTFKSEIHVRMIQISYSCSF